MSTVKIRPFVYEGVDIPKLIAPFLIQQMDQTGVIVEQIPSCKPLSDYLKQYRQDIRDNDTKNLLKRQTRVEAFRKKLAAKKRLVDFSMWKDEKTATSGMNVTAGSVLMP